MKGEVVQELTPQQRVYLQKIMIRAQMAQDAADLAKGQFTDAVMALREDPAADFDTSRMVFVKPTSKEG